MCTPTVPIQIFFRSGSFKMKEIEEIIEVTKKVLVDSNRSGTTTAVAGTIIKGFYPVKLEVRKNTKYRILIFLFQIILSR